MTAVDDLAAWLIQIWDEQEGDKVDELERSSQVRTIPHPNEQTGQRVAMCEACNLDWAVAGSRDEVEKAAAVHLREAHDHEGVLALIAAHRAILKLHGNGEGHECPDGFLDTAETVPHCGYEGNCLTIRLLASLHADRPGYREEWRA